MTVAKNDTVGGMVVTDVSEDEARVRVFKALADQARLKIVRILNSDGGEMNCARIGELAGGDVPMPNSTLSYHIRILREAGLTRTRKEGQNHYISLREDALNEYLPGFLETLDK